jgi:hypothetical protein
MPKHPYRDNRREQHGAPKVTENPPAATIAQALKNNANVVDKAKSK